MGSPGSAFDHVSTALEARGFTLAEDENHPEAFGSRFMIYEKDADSIRLVWDGKQEWLMLQRGGSDDTAWREIGLVRVGREVAGPAHLEALSKTLEANLR